MAKKKKSIGKRKITVPAAFKQEIKDFLLEEEGSITKSKVVRMGMTLGRWP